jgi:catechol-2,3-dioxygenase
MTQFTTGHVGLNVSNLANSKAFYEKIFGLQAAFESNEAKQRFAFMGDGERLMLTLWQQSDGRFADNRPGLHHLSFEVDSIQDVLAIESKLREAGLKIIYDGIVPHGEGQSSAALFFEDPDGIRLEVYTNSGGESYQAPHSDAPSCGFF